MLNVTILDQMAVNQFGASEKVFKAYLVEYLKRYVDLCYVRYCHDPSSVGGGLVMISGAPLTDMI